jgi:hypothetical protein
MGGLAKIVAPIASVIPGGQLVGAIATGISAMDSARQADKQNKAAQGQLQRQSDTMLSLVNDHYRPLYEAMLSGNKNNPDPFGLRSQALANNPYDLRTNSLRSAAFNEGIDTDADAAIRALTEDFADRGIAPSSAGAVARMGRVRSDQRSAAGNYRRDLAVRGQEYQSNALRQADMDTYQKQMNLLQSLSSLTSQGMGSLGGLQQQYASQSANANNAFGATIGALSKSGVFDDIFRRNTRPANAGDSTFATNQAGTPVPTVTPNGLSIPGMNNPYSSPYDPRRYRMG